LSTVAATKQEDPVGKEAHTFVYGCQIVEELERDELVDLDFAVAPPHLN
jgi:hypothetical protein